MHSSRLTPHFSLRRRLALLLAGMVCAAAPFAQASEAPTWPTKPVRLVVPFSPGGGADILARSLGETLQRITGQPFLVDNRPGAGGNIGADNAAKSAADGYTMLVGIDTTFTVNPLLYKGMPFKSSDLRPVMLATSQGLVMAVHPETGLNNLPQLIEHAKKHNLTLGSAGYGAPGHLASAIFSHATGAHVTHIPYKGNGPVSTAILSGEVDGGVVGTTAMLGHIQSGKVKALAVTTPERNPLLPEVPTVSELGHANLEQEILYAVWVPANTPDDIVRQMESALLKAVQDEKLRERMRINDMRIEGLVGAPAAQRLQTLADRYQSVISATGMKIE